MKIQWNDYKKHSYIIGVGIFFLLFLLILGASIAGYKILASREQVVNDIQTAELQKESNVEGITDTENIVKYFFQAVENQDLDKALRGFPIDELGTKADVIKLLENQKTVSNDTMIAPAKQYADYFPLASAELTVYYTQMFEDFAEEYQKAGGGKVTAIEYAQASEQLKPSYEVKKQNICESTGAEAVCEMQVNLKNDEGNYISGITLAKYYGYWKVLKVTSGLTGTSEKAYFLASESSTEESSDKSTINKLEKKLYDKNYKTEYKQREKNKKKIENLLDTEEVVLPANYRVSNNAYGENPRDLMERFIKDIEKGDVSTVMNYYCTDVLQEGDSLTAEKIQQQGAAAKNIQYFYYTILNKGKELTGTLGEIGKTADQIVTQINPQNMFYLDLMKVVEWNQESCTGYFWLAKKIYAVDFKLKESENGWQIEKIKDVKVVSQEEYDEKVGK